MIESALLAGKTTDKTLSVARTILEQLGGNRFIMFTGASLFAGTDNSLRFKIPTSNKIQIVSITLEPNDTYTMRFSTKVGAKSYELNVLSTHTDVYAEDLQEIFTDETGLYTHF